ncbi:MAG: NTP transferase domain-containing protein [bacterium]|nr:NTP transferase domain-containing protein [bacterium]
MKKNDQIAAVVLAAGRGVRMNSKTINKVMLPLCGRPMIGYTLATLKKLEIEKVIIVVGFARGSVKRFAGPGYFYVEQKKRMGTGHAVKCALEEIPPIFKEILVLNGDDSAFYASHVIKDLIKKHQVNHAVFTLLTIETKNPNGLGRILRDSKDDISAIIEEKDATSTQRKIKEINPACYVFRRSFLAKYLSKVRKSPVTGEYYLTDLVRLGVKSQERISSFKAKDIIWQGINTWEELQTAEKLMRRFKNGS